MCVHMYTRMVKHFAIFVISVACALMRTHYYQPPKKKKILACSGVLSGSLFFWRVNRPCTHQSVHTYKCVYAYMYTHMYTCLCTHTVCTHTYVQFHAEIMKIHVVNGCLTWRENPCVFPSGNNENTYSNGILEEGSLCTYFQTEIAKIVHICTQLIIAHTST